MRVTEVRILDEHDLAERLTDMRVWLDEHHYEPSTYTYFFLNPGMKIRVSFKIDDEGEEFAEKLSGHLLDIHLGSRPAPNCVALRERRPASAEVRTFARGVHLDLSFGHPKRLCPPRPRRAQPAKSSKPNRFL